MFIAIGCAFFSVSYLIRPADYSLPAFVAVFTLQLLGMFAVSMAVPAVRAGLTEALPAHLRGTGFGAFNLVAVVFGQAAAPFVVSAISNAFDENLRVAFLVVQPLAFIGAALLLRARKFLDDDMQKIMVAVLTAVQEEKERAGTGRRSPISAGDSP